MRPSNPIKQTFNRARQHYNEHCHLQTSVGSELIFLVKQFSANPSHIIDLGCGTGLITATLANTFSFETLHAIDIADELLAQAKILLTNKNINIYEADFNFLNLASKFDLCFANMSLHWSADLFSTLQQINKHMRANSLLAFSMPLKNTFTELNSHFAVNEYPDIETVNHLLMAAGFIPLHRQQQSLQFSFANTIEALRSIKAVGASHVGIRHQKSLRGKSALTNNITTLTYEIGYFIARSSHVA